MDDEYDDRILTKNGHKVYMVMTSLFREKNNKFLTRVTTLQCCYNHYFLTSRYHICLSDTHVTN